MTAQQIQPGSWLARASREELQQRILDEAAQSAREHERARKLIGERQQALADREAALHLAEDLARKAGVDVSRDEFLAGIAGWWEHVGRMQRAWDETEQQRWDVQRFATSLEEWADPKNGRLDGLSGAEVARRVGRKLGELFSAQGRASGRGKDLFARPDALTLLDVGDTARSAS